MVNPCSRLGVTGCSNSLFHFINSNISFTFLFLSLFYNHQVSIAFRNQFLCHLIDCFKRNTRYNSIGKLILSVNARHRLLVQIICDILTIKISIISLVLVGIHFLYITEQFTFGTSIFCSRKTIIPGTLQFHHHRFQSIHILAFLWNDYCLKSILGLADQILTIARVCLNKGTTIILGKFRETGIEHIKHHILDIVPDKIHHTVLQRVWCRITFHEYRNLTILLFLILICYIDRGIIVRYRFVYDLSSISRNSNPRPKFLDL